MADLPLQSYQLREEEDVVEVWPSAQYQSTHQDSSQVQAISTSLGRMHKKYTSSFNTGFTSTPIELPIVNPVMPLANINNPVPMMIQIPLVVPNFAGVQNAHQMQQMPQPPLQQVFPMQTTHSTNVLLLPSSEMDLYRLRPTVKPNIAGYCNDVDARTTKSA